MGVDPSVLGAYRACGKLILLGEHFVVHGSAALALPLRPLSTEVSVIAEPGLASARLEAPLEEAQRALSEKILAAALEALGLGVGAGLRVQVSSSIPVGYGLGSSAAFAVALTGALARAHGQPLAPEDLRARAHQLEHLSHGQPSGIDDTVITFERPIWFRRGESPRPLAPASELPLVLASSGEPGSTREAVARVGRLRADEPARFEELARDAARVVAEALTAFEVGALRALGRCLDESQELLEGLGVSSPGIDRLVEAAREAGALGAKLTGSGLGGFVVALARPGEEPLLADALLAAGAAQLVTVGGGSA